MNQKMHRLFCLLLALVLLAGMLPGTALPASAQATSCSSEEPVDYYGRKALAQLDNSTALLYAYDQIAAGVEESAESIYVYDGVNPISKEEVQTVMDAYLRDYTYHFWLGNSYTIAKTTKTVTRIKPTYAMSGTELENAKEAFFAAAEEILAGLDDAMSEYEKELYVHDALAQKVSYVSADNAHNAYGALVEGQAVCEGYAEALQYLLQRAGLQSFIAEGTATNTSGMTVGHAWNYVRVNGSYYQVDLTWDDQDEDVFHCYFNQPDAVMQEDHTTSDTAYALPVCDSDSAYYFKNKEESLGSYTASSVSKLLSNHGMRVHVYIPGNVEAFINWYYENILAIAKEAHITKGFSYGYTRLGRELILRINVNCDHASLTYVPEVEATCQTSGNIAYYICSCNKWFLDADAVTEITDHKNVTVAALGHDYSQMCEDVEHLRTAASDCARQDTYWYNCTNCAMNAKDDPEAADMWYEAAATGDHQYSLTDQGVLCSTCGQALSGNIWMGQTVYENLSDALAAAGENDTAVFLADVQEAELCIPAGVTVDLNGHCLTAQTVVSFGDILDSSDAAAGALAVEEFTTAGNSQLPVYDSTNGIYKFYTYTLSQLGVRTCSDAVIFGFAIDFENADAYALLAQATDTGLDVTMSLDWGTGSKVFAFDAGLMVKYAQQQVKYPALRSALMLTVVGADSLEAGTALTVTPAITAVFDQIFESAEPMIYFCNG